MLEASTVNNCVLRVKQLVAAHPFEGVLVSANAFSITVDMNDFLFFKVLERCADEIQKLGFTSFESYTEANELLIRVDSAKLSVDMLLSIRERNMLDVLMPKSA
ncbi:MAG: hypothetical protein ACRCZ9_02525 [Fusobacteriaceae bacterium]